MLLSSNRRRSRQHQKHRLVTAALVAFVLLCAAAYLYGGQLRIHLMMNRGRAYLQQGNLDQALTEFNRVLQLQANQAQAVDGIGLVYLMQGDPVRAEIKYEQAIKLGLRFNRRFQHTKIGETYLARGLYPQAELEFRHALALSPRDAQAHLGHGLALHALGRVAEAIDAYRTSLSLDSDLKLAQAQLNRARQELERGFLYYIFDRRQVPLARYALAQYSGRRYYSLAQYAAHLIGYVSASHGSAGLERSLASYLPGNTVTLTIDADWQHAADRALGWRKGSLVALNPQTGEILALVNHPSFNPNRVDEDWKKITHNKNLPLQNKATQGLYLPGSIFKLITAAAALDSKIDYNRIFPVTCTGAVRYGEHTFWCWKRHGQVDSLQAALDTSCNIAMAELGFALGPVRLYEYSNKFGFGSPIRFPFKSSLIGWSYPVATSTSPMVGDSRYELARYACGLGEGTAITPLHAAMLAATIANQGRMMAPFFIKEIKNIRGDVLATGNPTLLRTPITPAVAEEIKAFMVDTVRHGIGSQARVEGITVAGKTGTTGDSRQGLNGWFICFAPAEHPTVAVAIFTLKEGTGMDVATPIARLFLQDILK